MFLKLLVSAIESTLFRGGGERIYILSGVKEKPQDSEISTIVWVIQLLLAGIVAYDKLPELQNYAILGDNVQDLVESFPLEHKGKN